MDKNTLRGTSVKFQAKNQNHRSSNLNTLWIYDITNTRFSKPPRTPRWAPVRETTSQMIGELTCRPAGPESSLTMREYITRANLLPPYHYHPCPSSFFLHRKFETLSESRAPKSRVSAAASFRSLPVQTPDMAFISFVGRLLFASVFLLSAWQEFSEFGVDGGPAAKSLRPKFDIFWNHLSTHTGLKEPQQFEIQHLLAATIALKGIGGLLFILGSSLGAYLLLLHQAIATPILYDFYNYDPEKTEFNQLFLKFTQNLAFFGALLFFISMKASIPKRQLRKRAPKAKTT
ncbi:hypothetical protein GBA52_005302 [Prunus armeniaca]|nr:hypothetical protein GBA52_005302 [Prunus armeniaca]